MKSWEKKVMVYKVLGAMPFGANLMGLVRHHVAGLKDFDLGGRKYLFDDFKSFLSGDYVEIQEGSFVEIGAGWHPILSLVLHGLGADRIVLTDVRRHMKPLYASQAVEFVRNEGVDQLNRVGLEFDADYFQERLDALKGNDSRVFARLESAGIEYVAPLDFRSSPFSDGEFDCAYSNSCLGYIPVPILEGIFRETARVVRVGGHIVHSVHVYDDYCGDGSQITPVNFLRYSKQEWDRIGNTSIHYQNRLRPRDYVEMACDAGFKVEVEDRVFKRIPEFDCREVELHLDFQGLPDEEIHCRNIFMVAKRIQASSDTGSRQLSDSQSSRI